MYRIRIDGLDANKIRRQLEDAQRRAITEVKRTVERNVGNLVCPLHRQRPQRMASFSNEVRFKFCCALLARMAQPYMH
jgi:hypothetical protein